METTKTFTGISPSKLKWGKSEILWLAAVWAVFIIWSYRWASFIPIIVLVRLPGFARKVEIKISDEALSIHEANAVLWTTRLEDITSIELEESKRAITKATNKALLIRNNKNDSYFLPLDGMTFEGLEPNQLVESLNQAIRE